MKRVSTMIKKQNPELIVSVRPDTRNMCLNAFYKLEGGKSWERYPTSYPIPIDVMLPSYNPCPLVSASIRPMGQDGSEME